MNIRSQIALGTAQIGMPYGVANTTGKPDLETARALVQAAWAAGIDTFDTAEAYGDSEPVLGRLLGDLGIGQQARVVSKGELGAAGASEFAARIHRQLKRLNLRRLDAWLLHKEEEAIYWNEAFAAEAGELRRTGVAGRFGVSAYRPDAALRAVEEKGLDAVQFPASPFDRRFLRNGVAARLASAGAALFVRSVFLQGLCVMRPEDVPAGIHRGREAAFALNAFCARQGFAPDFFCLHYVLDRTARAPARLVLGMERLTQLERNIAILRAPPPSPRCFEAWDALWPDDIENLILPSRWNTPT